MSDCMGPGYATRFIVATNQVKPRRFELLYAPNVELRGPSSVISSRAS
jgi:hypothetical protein